MEQENKKRWYQGKVFNGSMGVFDFGLTYADRQKQNPNENKLVSAGIAGASAAAWMYIPGIMWAKTALDMGKGAGMAIGSYRKQAYGKQFAAVENRGVIGGEFQDTAFGATSRQRGLQAIQNSRLNARSALANEARSLHRF
jgi:hypothetical protein